jgi:hypothetical protein
MEQELTLLRAETKHRAARDVYSKMRMRMKMGSAKDLTDTRASAPARARCRLGRAGQGDGGDGRESGRESETHRNPRCEGMEAERNEAEDGRWMGGGEAEEGMSLLLLF